MLLWGDGDGAAERRPLLTIDRTVSWASKLLGRSTTSPIFFAQVSCSSFFDILKISGKNFFRVFLTLEDVEPV